MRLYTVEVKAIIVTDEKQEERTTIWSVNALNAREALKNTASNIARPYRDSVTGINILKVE